MPGRDQRHPRRRRAEARLDCGSGTRADLEYSLPLGDARAYAAYGQNSFVGKILELPLTTLQDHSLFNILGDYSIDLWKTQIQMISARHGLISFITHPDYLIETRARAVYSKLLVHLQLLRDQGRVWMTLPAEVDRWWRSRSRMTLVRAGDSWQIEGPDCHRARIAYARLENDHVVYDVQGASSASTI